MNIEEKLPPLELIVNEPIRDEAAEACEEIIPDYFWEVPACSSENADYHHYHCRRERGLWIHTLMVSTAYERLVESYKAQRKVNGVEADAGRAAVLLHDALKYGTYYYDGDATFGGHDRLAAERVRDETSLPDIVADAIAAHMGPWGEGPAPETPLERLVHQADMVASSPHITCGIYKTPEPIERMYPGSLPEVSE